MVLSIRDDTKLNFLNIRIQLQRCEHTIGANVKMAAVKDSSGLAGLALEEPVRKVETGKRETNINPTS